MAKFVWARRRARKRASASGHFEASLIATVHKGCPHCLIAHPRIRGLDTDICACGHDCGGTDQFAADQTVVTGGGFSLGIVKALLAAAAWLVRLAQRI